MADTAISGLTDGTTILTSDEVPVNRAGSNFRVVVGALAPLDDVPTARILDEAVTLAKMANMATASFIGRDTAAAGDPEVLSAADARVLLDVEEGANAPPFVTDDYTDASVTLAKLADIATASFIGRDTAADGVQEVLSATTARAILNVEDDAAADQTAAEVVFTPEGNISSTDVQAAIVEVENDAGIARAGLGASKADLTRTINAQTGTTFTLALTDAGDIVTMDNAAANTLTVPTNAVVAFAVGTEVNVSQLGAGLTTIDADTGVTLNGISGGTGDISIQFGLATLTKLATDTWLLSGNNDVVA